MVKMDKMNTAMEELEKNRGLNVIVNRLPFKPIKLKSIDLEGRMAQVESHMERIYDMEARLVYLEIELEVFARPSTLPVGMKSGGTGLESRMTSIESRSGWIQRNMKERLTRVLVQQGFDSWNMMISYGLD